MRVAQHVVDVCELARSCRWQSRATCKYTASQALIGLWVSTQMFRFYTGNLHPLLPGAAQAYMLTDSFLFLLPFTPTDVLFIGHHIMTTSAWRPTCSSQHHPTLSCQMRASAEHSAVLQALLGSVYIMAASVLGMQPHMLSSLGQ